MSSALALGTPNHFHKSTPLGGPTKNLSKTAPCQTTVRRMVRNRSISFRACARLQWFLGDLNQFGRLGWTIQQIIKTGTVSDHGASNGWKFNRNRFTSFGAWARLPMVLCLWFWTNLVRLVHLEWANCQKAKNDTNSSSLLSYGETIIEISTLVS